MKLSLISRKITFRIGIAAMVLIAGSFVLSFFVSWLSAIEALLFSAGVLLMSAVNCVKLILLERAARKVSDMNDSNRGKAYAWLQYLLRYFLTVIVAVVAIVIISLITGESPFAAYNTGPSPYAFRIFPPIIFGFAAGLLTMQVGIIGARHTKPDEASTDSPSASQTSHESGEFDCGSGEENNESNGNSCETLKDTVNIVDTSIDK